MKPESVIATVAPLARASGYTPNVLQSSSRHVCFQLADKLRLTVRWSVTYVTATLEQGRGTKVCNLGVTSGTQLDWQPVYAWLRSALDAAS